MKPNLPDWKQDQAETSRLPPKYSAECFYCMEYHDPRLACPEYLASKSETPSPVSTTAQCGAGEALLPCPFCGGKAVDRREIDGFPMIYCNGDNCFGPQTTARNFEDALVQWNTRSTPPSPVRAAQEDAYATIKTMREEIVLAIAFLGRDSGTDRLQGTVDSLIQRLAAVDKLALAALAAPPQQNGEG